MIGDNVDFISRKGQFSREEALLYVFEDNEAVIKMFIKGRSPTMRHMFPEPTELHLIGYLIELIWTPKIQIKKPTRRHVDDVRFTRDDWWNLVKGACHFQRCLREPTGMLNPRQ